MFDKLYAVVAAVKDVNAATRLYSDLFGTEGTAPEEFPVLGVKRTVFPMNDTFFELAEPLNADTPIGRFLEKRGEGLYLVAFEVSDLDSHVHRLRQKGIEVVVPEGPPSSFRLLGEAHRIAFIAPRFTAGVLVEMVERQLE